MADLYVVATRASKIDEADVLREVLEPAIEVFRHDEGCLAFNVEDLIC